jgi:hypothetical protein
MITVFCCRNFKNTGEKSRVLSKMRVVGGVMDSPKKASDKILYSPFARNIPAIEGNCAKILANSLLF